MANPPEDTRGSTWGDSDDAPPLDAPRTVTPETSGRYGPPDIELGRGGVGRVVLVHDRHLERDVARKELLPNANYSTVTRFLREARVTAGLEHPSIVPVHEVGETDEGTLYYTMKRIRGRSLREALVAAQGLPGRLALLGSFVSACQAIAYAHARGVVHRDLKPENIMLGEFGETLVVDWGLAKVVGHADERGPEMAADIEAMGRATKGQTLMGTTLGTPAYMSPEQACGEVDAVDARSDVWSLGAVLYEILAGKPPVDGESALSIVAEVRAGRVDVDPNIPGAPPELQAIVRKGLSIDPAGRYPNAKGLADDIVAWQQGRWVAAHEYSAGEVVLRLLRQYRGYVSMGMAAAILLIGGGIVSYVRISAAYGEAVAARAETAEIARQRTAALGQTLTGMALDRWRARDYGSARVLAAEALSMAPGPGARGALVAAMSGWQPMLSWSASSGTCATLSYDPTGTTLACASEGQLWLWDATGKAEKRALPAGAQTGFSWSPSGQAYGFPDGHVARLVDAKTGATTREFTATADVVSLVPLSDGGMVVGTVLGTLEWFDATAAAGPVVAAHTDWVRALAVSRDGLPSGLNFGGS